MDTMATLIAIQNGLSFIVALSMWLTWLTLGFLLLKVKKPDHLTPLTMLYLSAYALGMTFEVKAVYLAFDAWVGIPNLSWLIAWLGITVAVYLITCVFYLVKSASKLPLWLHLIFAITLAIYAITFWLGIRYNSEQPWHVVPRDGFDFVFMQTLFVFGAFAFLVIANSEVHIYLDEKGTVGRIRWGIAIIVAVGAATFFILRVILTLWGYLYPGSPFVVSIYALALTVQILTGSLLSLPFLPTRFLLHLTRPLIAIDKIWGLRKLRVVQSSLDSFFPPVVLQKMTWWEVIKNIRFYEYRTLITILDSKTMLEACLNTLELPSLERNNMVVFRAGDDPKTWDEPTRHKATVLFSVLRGVDDSMEFDELVYAYRRIGTLLQKGGT